LLPLLGPKRPGNHLQHHLRMIILVIQLIPALLKALLAEKISFFADEVLLVGGRGACGEAGEF